MVGKAALVTPLRIIPIPIFKAITRIYLLERKKKLTNKEFENSKFELET